MPAAPPPPVHAPAPVIDSAFDLRRLPGATARPCRGGHDEIVVCANRDADRNRVGELDDEKFAPGKVRAEMRLAGEMTGGVHVEQVEIAPGQISQRVLVDIKLPF